MSDSQLWLTVLQEDGPPEWPPALQGLQVAVTRSETLHACNHACPFRTSPIFPVQAGSSPPDVRDTFMFFYCFDPAFPVLGRLVNKGSAQLLDHLFFTIGLASIVLITPDESLADEAQEIAGEAPAAREVWQVKDSRIVSVTCDVKETNVAAPQIGVRAYHSLPLSARAAVDEFVANMAVILPKAAAHMPTELTTFTRLMKAVDELVGELVYVSDPQGDPPDSLSEYSSGGLSADPSLCETIMHQAVDRIIQINSALSYLSTQALTGAVPIIERRSLIRRYSLLGVGTAVLAITRIARSIEHAFAQAALEELFSDRARDARPLPGLDELPAYDASKWARFSVNEFAQKVSPREPYPRLPYFSGRLGFREAEYTISAALQALASGATPEWSLLTLTHEMVHGHVRNLLSYIFQDEPGLRPEERKNKQYAQFKARVDRKPQDDENLVSSIRTVMFTYCGLACNHGSLTRPRRQPDFIKSEPGKGKAFGYHFTLLPQETFWLTLEQEHRNISEILVHVLDLHYFYASRLSAYIPLIWRSWATLPHVMGDMRQYLLRSLLAIATKKEGTPHRRFKGSRTLLKDLLSEGGGQAQAVQAACKYLDNAALVEDELFYPFMGSLILVDLAHHVLTSKTIRASLIGGDDQVEFVEGREESEDRLEYAMPDGFVDEIVKRPSAYLIDRLQCKLTQPLEPADVEAETSRLFLACCSNVRLGEDDYGQE